jgi:glyoxylase-like metal-dependent hydrolase (beta-lactamase superfamily II)
MKEIVQGLWEINEIGDGVHCYLWEWSGGLTLIDTGFTRDAETILQALVRHHHPLHNVRRIIVTHADMDHSGGLSKVKHATRAAVVCHAVEKEPLEHPLRRQPASIWMRLPVTLAALFAPGYRMASVSPDELVVDGQLLPEGFTVIHTPGHTAGHISLLHPGRRLLIAGDALSNRGGKLRSPHRLYTPDPVNADKSIWKLAKKYGDNIETVVFGHGPPILVNGGKRIKGLASQIYSTAI